MTFLGPFLIFVFAALLARERITVARLRAATRTHALAGRSDDEDMLAMLEAHATTSELASRLLVAARIAPDKLLPKSTPISDVESAHATQWEFVWRQYDFETTDVGRAVAVEQYLEAGIEFTDQQKTLLLEQVEDEERRNEVRRALYPPQKKKKLTPFRWSKQANTMLCTMTCRCGKPAKWVTGPELAVQCDQEKPCQGRVVRTRIVMTKKMIFVNPNGDAWRYVGNGEFCKAAID